MDSLIKNALKDDDKKEVFSDQDMDEELVEVLKGLKTKIVIVGLGGAGGNTLNRIAEEGVKGAALVAANTDAQHLLSVHADRKVLMGRNLTRGLGAGSKPEIGEKAAEEAIDNFEPILEGADIVFLTCGLGGGTGTGSIAPIARMAKEKGALTIAVMTKPFSSEGKSREKNAVWGIQQMKNLTDTVIIIPNDKLVELFPRLSLNKAFKIADEILMRSIKGLTEMITKPGLVNLDYNDLKTVMQSAGMAMVGMGESSASGDNRALEAIEEAINSPLLDVDISGAKGALINVTGGSSMTIREAEMVAEEIERVVSPDAHIIWGCNIKPELENTLRVMLVATGIKSKHLVVPDKKVKKIQNVY